MPNSHVHQQPYIGLSFHHYLSSNLKNTMHSRAISKKFPIPQTTSPRFRSHSLIPKSNPSSSSPPSENNTQHLLKWISSGFLIVGFCSLPISSSSNDSSESQTGKNPRFLFPDSYRRRFFFNYEKRIRNQSPPEKIFEYFASVQTPNGQPLMTPADLMRAVVPVFPPSESDRIREGYLRGERPPGEFHCPNSEFFMLFDTNNDGFISFPEYIFFVTLLSIPESSFSVAFKMFDLDGNGGIDRDEFKKVMRLMREQNRQGAEHRDGRRRIGFRVSNSVENGGLIEYFFGEDGDRLLRIEKFEQFLKDLHNEILQLEFAYYDCKSSGTISAKDFGLSLVASADIGDIDRLLDRVEEVKDDETLKNIRISFEDFRSFAELRRRLRSLSFAIFAFGKVNGLLTKTDFQRAAYQVCGVSLTDNVVDVIFHVFDANRDGNLSSDEFVKVLQRRERVVREHTDVGIGGLLGCCVNCLSSCSSRKVFMS